MKSITVALLLFIISHAAFSQITGVAMALALDEMEDKLNGVIQNAENSANNVINNGALQGNYTIYNFRETYKDLLKKTSDVADSQAYNIFLGIRKSTDKIFAGTTDFVAELDNTVANLRSVMATVPLLSKRPYISKTQIPVFVKDNNITSYELQFNGSLLDQKHEFKLNGQKLIASEIGTNKIVYHLEDEILEKALQGRRVNFELSYKYGGFLGLFRRKASFKFFTNVIPLQFGIVDLQVSTSTSDTIKIARQEQMPETRTGGSNWRGRRRYNNQTFNVYPLVATNVIDVSSVRLETLENRYGYGAGITNRTPAGITIYQNARSDGRPYGGGGKVVSRVSFTEWQINNGTVTQEVKNLPLKFNEPLAIQLPKNSVAIQQINVKLFDGKTTILTMENINKNFEVDFRKSDSMLFIRNVKL